MGEPKRETVRRAGKRAKEVAMSQDTGRITVTVSLQKANYRRLKAVCKEEDRDWVISRVLDSIVEAFLDEVEKEGT